jgi:hydrogenase expression/formation protein
MDDSGVVRLGGGFLTVTVDGMHSRLSDFPLLAGFHCTRAALRDIYVMGTKPLALLCDLHLADDGDVGRILDFVAGVSAVGDSAGVPLVTGSTLRIGGDMVVGKRLTGCVGAVGYGEKLTPRRDIEAGDVLLMTSGAGGGTVTTTAIYHGRPDVVDATLNVDFLRACDALLDSPALEHVHAMTDVTNGGLRGDCAEMSGTSGVKIVVDGEAALDLIHPVVRDLLDGLEIDALGLSVDALLVACPAKHSGDVAGVLRDSGVRCEKVGRVEDGQGTFLVRDGELVDFTPRFRESAYTPIKKVAGEVEPPDWDEMKAGIDRIAGEAVIKKEMLLDIIGSSYRSK